MGLMNKKLPTKKPTKKMPPKPKKLSSVEETVEQTKEETVKDEAVETQEVKSDVNADEKNGFVDGENLENEKNSENETKIKELEVKDEEDNATLKIDEDGDVTTPVEDLKTISEVEEETKPKRSRKRNAKKKETIDMTGEKITDVEEAEEYLSDVINLTSKEWEQEKEKLSDAMKTLTIQASLNPDELKRLLSEMSNTYTTIKERLVDVEKSHKSLQKQIKDVRTLNSIGSNATERNLNAQKAVMFFKKNSEDEKSIDLEQYDLALQDKIDFYRSCIDTMSYNRQLLITFASAFKIEINNY